MTLLWQKPGIAVDERVQRFLAGDDVVLDRALFLYDLAASRAHVDGLQRIGILDEKEAGAIGRTLEELADEFRDGRYVLDARHEDGHSAIEAFLVEKLGDAGKKVHTGRSRNDQVLVALRLYERDALTELDRLGRAAALAFCERAALDEKTPMAGYTHLQRAVPSSVGLWLGAFAESFVDDVELVRATLRWIDRCPLGTAAGYGVNLPLDRAGVAQALDFRALQWNPMYAQNSRGKLELQVLSSLGQLLLDVRRFAWDLSLYTSAEFAFVKLPARFTTGSSIMPNKRNPDVVELLRAAYAQVAGATVEIEALLSLPSGYHRDLQATKGPLLRAVDGGLLAMALLPELVRGLEFDREKMRAAIDPELFATDRAVELARAGVPFREAYQRVAADLPSLAARSPEESVAARGDFGLQKTRARLAALDAASPR
jgi:argininosuccinate lyase